MAEHSDKDNKLKRFHCFRLKASASVRTGCVMVTMTVRTSLTKRIVKFTSVRPPNTPAPTIPLPA